MTIEHHDLVSELPEFRDEIHDLKVSDNHFRKLFDKYHDLDKEIRRAELEIEPRADLDLEQLKKERLLLKDTLHDILKKKHQQTEA